MATYPCKVMFETLKDHSRLSNKEVALALFRSDYKYGDRLIHDRISDDRTFLSRYITGSAPGDLPRNSFNDFAQSAQNIAGQIYRKSPSNEALRVEIIYYASEAAEAMASALKDVGQSPHPYMNMVSSIIKRKDLSDIDRISLLVLLFVSAGCLADVSAAVDEVTAFSENMLATGFQTDIAIGAIKTGYEGVDGSCERLGLMRRAHDFQGMQIYEIATDEQGTVIGRHPSGPSAIDNVDDVVSSNHLRIWRSEDGRWLAEGMGSTNGSVLVSKADNEEHIIEPPRRMRDGWTSAPVEIKPGDILRLAGTTEFVVLAP